MPPLTGEGASGPWLATTDEITDPLAMHIRTFLNGQLVQDDITTNMVHRIPVPVKYISSFSALSPGGVIITGTIKARRTENW